MRRLEGAEIWIQQVIRAGAASIVKINGKQNPADLFTKYLTRSETIRHMAVLGFELRDAYDNELGCKDVDLTLSTSEIKEIEGVEENEIDALLAGVLRSYAENYAKLGSSSGSGSSTSGASGGVTKPKPVSD